MQQPEGLALDSSETPAPTFMDRFQTRPRVRWLQERVNDLAAAISMTDDERFGFTEIDTRSDEEIRADKAAREADFEAQLRRSRVGRELRIRQALTIDPADLIDPLEYAERKITEQNWTMVEIGPGHNPSGINREFTGGAIYIGIENFSYGEYSDTAEEVFEALKSQRAGENIFLMQDMAFGRQLWAPSERNLRYDLPDGTADEVYASQVYDKTTSPTCKHNHDEQIMTEEIARLLTPGGFVVIFDYDRNAESIVKMLADAGLKLRFASRETQFDIEADDYHVRDSVRHARIVRQLGNKVGNLLIIASK